jgi:hypothetical protein
MSTNWEERSGGGTSDARNDYKQNHRGVKDDRGQKKASSHSRLGTQDTALSFPRARLELGVHQNNPGK